LASTSKSPRKSLINFVTNGYITPEALDLVGPYLAAHRVDLKGFSNQVYGRLTPSVEFRGVLEIIKRAKDKWDMHILNRGNIWHNFCLFSIKA
jgi:pyruvate-formate lyase-activating enzyme